MHLLLLFASATVLSALQAAFLSAWKFQARLGRSVSFAAVCSFRRTNTAYCIVAILVAAHQCEGKVMQRFQVNAACPEVESALCGLCVPQPPQEDLSARINELRSERKGEGARPKHRGFYSHNDANGMLLPNLPAAIVTALACSDAEHHATHVANALALGTCLKRQQAALPAIIGLEITQRMSAPSRACSVSLLLW